MSTGSICPYPYEDCDSPDVWSERKVVARKTHRCYECGGQIPAGMTYGRAKSLLDGMWNTHRRCASCMILAEWVATVTGECPLWGGLADSVFYANDSEGTAIPSPADYRRKWDDERP